VTTLDRQSFEVQNTRLKLLAFQVSNHITKIMTA